MGDGESMKIKLIIFDLWRTLAYKKGNENHAPLRKMLKETNTDIPLDKFVKIFENSVQLKKWKSKYRAYENLCKNMGLETNKKNIFLLRNLRDNVESKTKLYAHTIKMLKSLKKKGYKIGLISNSSIFSIEPIKKTRLLKLIDYPLFSFNVEVIKPNLKIFKKMLKISKCKPSEVIMIGDKIKDDVIPPKKIGMNSIHLRNYSQLKRDLRGFGIDKL